MSTQIDSHRVSLFVSIHSRRVGTIVTGRSVFRLLGGRVQL